MGLRAVKEARVDKCRERSYSYSDPYNYLDCERMPFDMSPRCIFSHRRPLQKQNYGVYVPEGVEVIVAPNEPENTMRPNKIARLSKDILEEYMSLKDLDEVLFSIDEKFQPPYLDKLIKYIIEWVIDRKVEQQILVGQLFQALLEDKIITVDQLLLGTAQIIELLADLQPNIPKMFDNLGQVFALCLVDGVLSLQDLLRIVDRPRIPEPDEFPLPKELGITVFAKTLSAATKLLGVSCVRSQWVKSGLKWEDYLTETPVGVFLRKHEVNFTVEDEPEPEIVKPVAEIGAVYSNLQVKKKLLSMFKRNAMQEEIFSWIEVNVGSNAKSPAFVRALSQALIESKMIASSNGSSLVIADDFLEGLQQQANIITKYVDHNKELEMAVILGIQQLSTQNQHAIIGLMVKSFCAFHQTDVLSKESLFEWENIDGPQPHLCIKFYNMSVRRYLTWLRISEPDEI